MQKGNINISACSKEISELCSEQHGSTQTSTNIYQVLCSFLPLILERYFS